MVNRIFYQIYPLGLLGAPERNSFDFQPTSKISKLKPWLDHMLDLGCDALYLGPVFESVSHGYDTVDFFRVDRRLGSNKLLKELIDVAHSKGIAVVLDAVFNHVGREFWAFKDLLKNKNNSRYRDWFKNVDFSKEGVFLDGFSYSGWQDHYQLVELNHENPEVRVHLLEAVRFWINFLNIDGLRLDTADILDKKFLIELSTFTKTLHPEFWLLGETVSGNYLTWVNDKMLDSVTNYELHSPLYECFNKHDFNLLGPLLQRQSGARGKYRNVQLYTFVDNHDVNRAFSSLINRQHLPLLYALLFTLPGVPSIYYGSEFGYAGTRQGFNDTELRPAITYSNRWREAKYPEIFQTIKQLISLRKELPSLGHGNFILIVLRKKVLVFAREFENERIVAAYNLDNSCVELKMVHSALETTEIKDVLDRNLSINVIKGSFVLNLPPLSFRLLSDSK
ncbi:alpha-amylase family glycosyl hydrolase [Cytophaga sp. FL35]|uniref:alpha-amylase family glycosyl hydrolase n=1 Tax=Cytophaga sp. FL35 TaxID=1904456 RepID=UPI001653925E|nr:alpha-amylase family glycosyl hydrolase [Cytophaga sp. FL35]MBC6996943.1 alpha-amylase [Cytophaga sp. FL35]